MSPAARSSTISPLLIGRQDAHQDEDGGRSIRNSRAKTRTRLLCAIMQAAGIPPCRRTRHARAPLAGCVPRSELNPAKLEPRTVVQRFRPANWRLQVSRGVPTDLELRPSQAEEVAMAGGPASNPDSRKKSALDHAHVLALLNNLNRYRRVGSYQDSGLG